MTQSSPHASTEMSLSAVYRQLDDRLGADDAQYDVDSGSQRFLAWLCDEVISEDERRHVESGIEAERQAIDHELLQLRMKALDRTTHARQRSLLIAMCAVAL